jgi:hypothetical protein
MATINIEYTTNVLSCKEKCSYGFNYQNSTCVAINNGNYIGISYDKGVSAPVVYNSNKYEVSSMYIYSPSIHKFGGSLVAGEIVIEHSPISGGQYLNVSIPITEYGVFCDSLNQIISDVAKYAPAQSESTTIQLKEFTLNKIVPNKPFLTYSQDNTVWIVFEKSNAISISAESLKSLSTIIEKYDPLTSDQQPLLYYNSTGPSLSHGSSDIYIDCKPISSSDEMIDITTNKPDSTAFDWSNISSNSFGSQVLFSIFIVLLCIIFLVLMYYGIKSGTNYFGKKTSSISTV